MTMTIFHFPISIFNVKMKVRNHEFKVLQKYDVNVFVLTYCSRAKHDTFENRRVGIFGPLIKTSFDTFCLRIVDSIIAHD